MFLNSWVTFSKENIWVKRPGTGDFLAKEFTKLIGADIEYGQHLSEKSQTLISL